MITLNFHAETWHEIETQMRRAIGAPAYNEIPKVDLSTFTDFPDNNEADHSADPDPEPTPADVIPKPKRSHRKAPPPAPALAPEAPEEPIDALGVGVKLTPSEPEDPAAPTLDALKQIVTRAVRAAQKKEGPTKILDLLPDFKAKTKLDFVMNAEDEHMPALAALIAEAGLPAV